MLHTNYISSGVPLVSGEKLLHLVQTYWKFRDFIPRVAINYLKKQPFAASFDITRNCNCQCPYCYYYGKPSKYRAENLSDEELLTFMRNVKKEIPIIHATFIGGEPTLMPNLYGLTIDEARMRLKAVGDFEFIPVCQDCQTASDSLVARVISQNPVYSEGALIMTGSTVTVIASKAFAPAPR